MERILRYLNNYFFRFKETGTFTIKDNILTGINGTYLKGQYILLEGSYLNDTVYEVVSVVGDKITLKNATDEDFEGVVYSLAVPRNLVELKTKIDSFEADNKPSSLQSESFGNYSYSNKSNKNGDAFSWQDAYRSELKPYRKMYSGKERVKVVEVKSKVEPRTIIDEFGNYVEWN